MRRILGVFRLFWAHRTDLGVVLGIVLIAFLMTPLQKPPAHGGYYDCSDCAATYDCLEVEHTNLAYEMVGKQAEIDAKQGEIEDKNADIANAMAAGEDPTPLLLERKALEVERDQLQQQYDLMDAKLDGIVIGFGCCQ